MCRPVPCKICGKTTWAGCGQHIAQVKAEVPSADWCNGQHSDATKTEATSSSRGWFSRTFGR